MTEAAMEVVDLGNFPVDEATPVVSGPRGRSAYEVAVANGFVGTEAEWLASLAAGGEVSSVNDLTGDVVLDAAAVGAESPAGAQARVDTHAADTTDVHGIADTSVLATTADVSAASTADRARGNHTGQQSSATISDFTEAVQDAVAALLSSGANVTLTYNDAGNTLTVAAASGGDAELMRDTIGAALVGVGNITVVPNDAGDTIAISTTATVNSTDAALRDRSTHTGSQAAATISDLAETVQDLVGSMVVAGSNVTAVYNDTAGTLTLGATGSGPAAGYFGRFRGEWAPEELAWADDFTSGINTTRYTLSHAGVGSDPTISTVSAAGQTGAPVGYTNAVTFPQPEIQTGNSSTLTLPLAGLGIANITRVAVWVAHASTTNVNFKAARVTKNGVTQNTDPAPFAWQQWSTAANSTDTIAWQEFGNAATASATITQTLFLTGLRVYAAPAPYMLGEFVAYQGKLWRSDVDNNAATPGASGWTEVPIGSPTLNPQTGTAYTLAVTDASKLVTMSNASASTVTVPTNATAGLVVGTKIQVANMGAGAATVSPASGVTIQQQTGASLTLAQYQAGTLTKTGTDTWLWQPSSAASGGGSALTVQDENANVSTAVSQIDFQGPGVTVSSGTGEVIVTIPGGSGSGSGGILAYKKQAVGTTPYTTTSTTFVDVDATNLVVAFTAPASGAVLVRLSTLASDSGINGYNWGLREGTTTVAQSSAVNDSSGARRNYVSMPLVVTGLTPGSSHTYKWAHSHDVSGTGSMWGTTNIPAVMEVLALP